MIEKSIGWGLWEGDSFEDLAWEISARRRTLVYFGRNIFWDENRKNIYGELTQPLTQEYREEVYRDGKEFNQNEHKHIKRIINRKLARELHRIPLQSDHISKLIEIPFHIFLSFEELFQRYLQEGGHDLENWPITQAQTFNNYRRSDQGKFFSFPSVNRNRELRPVVFSQELLNLIGLIAGNRYSFENIIYDGARIETVVILGVHFDLGSQVASLLDLLLGLLGGDYLEKNDILPHLIQPEIGKSLSKASLQELKDFYDSLNRSPYWESPGINQQLRTRLILVPLDRTEYFISALHSECDQNGTLRKKLIDREKIRRRMPKMEEPIAFLAKDKQKPALEWLDKWDLNEQQRDDLIHLKGKLAKLENDNNMGIIDYDTYIRHRNGLRLDILSYIQQL